MKFYELEEMLRQAKQNGIKDDADIILQTSNSLDAQLVSDWTLQFWNEPQPKKSTGVSKKSA